MKEPLRVHILFEHGKDEKPFSTSYIRLIQPLTHPSIASVLNTTYGLELPDERVDILILDRLWRSDVSLSLVNDLVNQIRQMGANFIYHLDDNFFDLVPSRKSEYPPKEYLDVLPFLLNQADGVLVSTMALKKRLLSYNSSIKVVPNALDERLFSVDARNIDLGPKDPGKITIGYMGTHTHDDDLKLVVPALKKIVHRHRGKIQIEVVGVIGNRRTLWRLRGLPLQYVSPKLEDIEYVRFLPWFTAKVRWDIALAPLVDTKFTRSKSDIKFLDYAAIGAPGIFSHGSVYSPTIQHMKTGWLAHNHTKSWVEALEALIMDETLRRDIAFNASHYLHDERVLARCAENWVVAIRQLLGYAQDKIA